MPDLNDAMSRLEAAEAAEQPITQDVKVQTDGDSPATPPEPASDDIAPQPDPLPSDTPAAAYPKPAEPAKTPNPKTADKGTPFAKDKLRRDDSWKALNEQKATVAQQEAQLRARTEAHQREVENWKLQQAKSKTQYTPEQIEARASQHANSAASATEQAEAFQAQADAMENAGNLKGAAQAQLKADAMKEQANEAKAMAKALKRQADIVRQQPPDNTLVQHKAKLDQQMRGYTMKAVEQWPEFGKKDSQFQKSVASGLQEASKMGLDVNENPGLLYYAARLVAGETAAARVPAMEKELGELRAKVKELDGLTAPGGGKGSAQRQPSGTAPKTDAEEESELRAIAVTL